MARRRTTRTRAPRNPWLVLKRSRIHGRGVYARTHIPKGTRLIEYTGERISNVEADRRYDDEKMRRHHTFLFILNSRSCIDAAVGGNIARFINHSCDPNCVAWIEGRHIWIDALRDIKAGEELNYDYGLIIDEPYTKKLKAEYPCWCGSTNCRGTLLAPKRGKR